MLKTRCVEILLDEETPLARLRRLSCFLHGAVARWDWFGFYLVIPRARELVLGPFSGEPTEHRRIPFGRGICGQAAEQASTFIVDDVSAQSNYLACSLKVKSEIVVPVFDPEQAGHVVAEIDVDSHTPSAFSPADRDFLEALARSVARDAAALSAGYGKA